MKPLETIIFKIENIEDSLKVGYYEESLVNVR